MDEQLLIRSSPHLRHRDSTPRIMWSVVIALAPAAAVSIYFFGWAAVRVTALSIVAAVAAEVACLAAGRKPLRHALDGSAVVTGLLLAMVLPPSTAWYCPVVGSAFAMAIAKHCFGGLGHNIWNPALAGRIFLQFAYPAQVSLSEWTVPRLLIPNAGGVAEVTTEATYTARAADVISQASPLAAEGAINYSYFDLFLGNGVPGSLGETCKLALLIGGIYLIVRRRIDWRVPLFYVGTVFALSALLPAGQAAPAWMGDPYYHVLSGGLFLGAFFMATDMVTTPVTPLGRIVFAIGCGVLVALIRLYGGYPEGVAYSIIIMNTVAPLIDRWCRPVIYGSRTPRPAPREI